MRRIHHGTSGTKYRNGTWSWNEQTESVDFHQRQDNSLLKEEFMKTGGFKFSTKLNQMEESIFRQEFQRSSLTHDADVILLEDVKNVVLFLAPCEILTKRFIYFINTATVNRFLQSLIVYFEYYLKLVEFVLIRRDDITGVGAQVQSTESTEIKRIFSNRLTQYRLILARNYSPIILGTGDMAPYYHIKPIVNISQSIKDKQFHESFLAFATQVVWITMHRRAYDVIDTEMNRLFRSEHFKLTRGHLQFSITEAEMLFGKNYRRVNYRAQNSPLIQELLKVSVENTPILWIGDRKYRGDDYRALELELEYILPASQLCMIDVAQGILGHPKMLYDTLLHLDWEAVRFQNYSEEYDPYHIIRQPSLKKPEINEDKIRKYCKQFESYYSVQDLRELPTKEVLRQWYNRDKVVTYYNTEGKIESVWSKCEQEMEDKTYGKTVEEITLAYMEAKKKLKKHK